MKAAITDRSIGGIFEFEMQMQGFCTALKVTDENDQQFGHCGEFKKGVMMQVMPIKIAVAVGFEPAPPHGLPFARIQGALVSVSGSRKSGKPDLIGMDLSHVVDLIDAGDSRLVRMTILGADMQLTFNVDRGGNVQLIARGGVNLTVADDERLETMDRGDDRTPIAFGEIGIRLLKRLSLRGKLSANYFDGDDEADSQALQGWGASGTAGVDLEIAHGIKLYGEAQKFDTSGLRNNQGHDSVTSGTAGILMKFW